jgi:hypothetical protein
MARCRRMGVVPWPGQQTVQARLRLGREGEALSRLIRAPFRAHSIGKFLVVCSEVCHQDGDFQVLHRKRKCPHLLFRDDMAQKGVVGDHLESLAKQTFFNLREKFVEPLFCTIHFSFVKLNLSL